MKSPLAISLLACICDALPSLLRPARSLLAQLPGPAPRFDAWKIIGPGGGGTTIDPTISPSDPNLVVEYSDMTGGYITHDGGQSWRMFNLRSNISTFAFDPGNPDRIYAGGEALWRSDNSGRTWRMIFPNPSLNTVEHQNGDHSDYSLTSNDKSYVSGLHILQIVVDPGNSSILHIAFSYPQSRGTTLLISKDGGASFHNERSFPSDELPLLAYYEGRSRSRSVPRASTGARRSLPSPSRGVARRSNMPAPEC